MKGGAIAAAGLPFALGDLITRPGLRTLVIAICGSVGLTTALVSYWQLRRLGLTEQRNGDAD